MPRRPTRKSTGRPIISAISHWPTRWSAPPIAASRSASCSNDAVIARLAAHGLHAGLHVRRRARGLGHLHAKIYAFSHPQVALVGSFNPSGNDPEDAAVIAEIGDQDRGWNLLLGLRDPALVEALRSHVGRLATIRPGPLDRFRAGFRRAVVSGDTALFFFSRLRTAPVEADLATAGPGDTIRAAVSHL